MVSLFVLGSASSSTGSAVVQQEAAPHAWSLVLLRCSSHSTVSVCLSAWCRLQSWRGISVRTADSRHLVHALCFMATFCTACRLGASDNMKWSKINILFNVVVFISFLDSSSFDFHKRTVSIVSQQSWKSTSKHDSWDYYAIKPNEGELSRGTRLWANRCKGPKLYIYLPFYSLCLQLMFMLTC